MQSFSDSLAVVKAGASSNWLPRVNGARKALEILPVSTLSKLAEAETGPMRDLLEAIDRTLRAWAQLTENE